MTDIIDKLRALGTGYVGTTRGHTATLMNEAADVIEALRAENEKLREALSEVLGWYDRDGSVGGCDVLVEDVVRPLLAKLPGRE